MMTVVRCRTCGSVSTVSLDIRGTMAHRRAFLVEVDCKACGGIMREITADV
jgi:hypothetical protein